MSDEHVHDFYPCDQVKGQLHCECGVHRVAEPNELIKDMWVKCPGTVWPDLLAWLEELITQTPMPHVLPTTCIYCGSKEITEISHEETSIGWWGNRPDPNHHWRLFHCSSCNQDFLYQHSGCHGWYTEGRRGKSIKGVSGCYEPQIYTCKHCGGDVVLDGERQPRSFRMPLLRPHRDPYKCLGCGWSTKADDGGCDAEAAARPRSKLDFTATEELGYCIVNPRALKQLQLGGHGEESK